MQSKAGHLVVLGIRRVRWTGNSGIIFPQRKYSQQTADEPVISTRGRHIGHQPEATSCTDRAAGNNRDRMYRIKIRLVVAMHRLTATCLRSVVGTRSSEGSRVRGTQSGLEKITGYHDTLTGICSRIENFIHKLTG